MITELGQKYKHNRMIKNGYKEYSTCKCVIFNTTGIKKCLHLAW